MVFQVTQQAFPDTKLFFPDPEKLVAEKPQRINTIAKTVFANAATASRSPEFRAEEMRAIEAHNGVLWDCIGRISANPGYIYEFIEKTDVNRWVEQDRIFPALEIMSHKLAFLDNTKLSCLRMEWFDLDVPIEVLDLLQPLGYRSYRDTKTCFFDTQGVLFLTLPDREALLARWEILIKKLKASGSQLSQTELKVLDSVGIATDEEYVKGYFENDIILSTEKEFVHDHIHHALSTLVFMLNEESYDYKEVKTRWVEEFRKIYQRLVSAETLIDAAITKGETGVNINNFVISLATVKKNLPKAMAWLSGTVDRVAALHRRHPNFDKQVEDKVNQIMDDDYLSRDNYSYSIYLRKRFPWSQYGLSTKQIWDAIDTLEATHKVAQVK